MRKVLSLSASLLNILGVLILASPSVFAQNDVASEEIDTLVFQKYWNFFDESRFESQNFRFRRCAPGETMLLGEFFRTLELPTPVRSVVCSKDIGGITSVWNLPDKAAIEGFDILSSVTNRKEGGMLVPKTGENVILSLEFGLSDPYTSGILFIRNTSGYYPKHFMRVSVILSPKVEKDDLRSFSQSDSAPITGSYLLSFDTGDTSAYMEEFKEVLNSALEKNKAGLEYSDLEHACIFGLMDTHSISTSLSEADEDMEEGRYFDAITHLKKVIDAEKYFGLDDESDRGVYADACADLAKCYSAAGDPELACRFYEAAYTFDDSYDEEYAVALAALGDIRARGVDYEDMTKVYTKAIASAKKSLEGFSPFITMRDVVCKGLGIPECGIQSLTAFDMDGKTVLREDSRAGALDARLGPLLSDGNTLVFDYDLRHELTQVDSSNVLYDNSLVILVKRIKDTPDKFRLNVLIPNFINDDTQSSMFNGGNNGNRPSSISFVVSSGEKGDIPTDLGELFHYAIEVQDDGRYVESLKLLYHVLDAVKASDYESGEYDISSLIDIYYEIGFCLTELGQWDKALYYQAVASQSGVTDYIVDYLSTVINNREPVSLGEIDKYMSAEVREGNMSKEAFKAFLMRRKIYYLVEMRRYDEAEPVIKELMDDPDQADWAKSELEYIHRITSE